MERYIINLKSPVENIEAIIKSAEKVDVIIRNLPNRFYISPEYRVVLLYSMVASLFKNLTPQRHETRLSESVGILLSYKQAHLQPDALHLASQATSNLTKQTTLKENKIQLSAIEIPPMLVRYRKLIEMDTDGIEDLTLDEFDAMTLGDIDWYEI